MRRERTWWSQMAPSDSSSPASAASHIVISPARKGLVQLSSWSPKRTLPDALKRSMSAGLKPALASRSAVS
ncbi:Hypothetical protein PFR_JS12-1_2022 [Propionibacterium freudenreichii]|nr:Hypothetical protein PFR_JS12-2_2021 [Propionibacterium freudenreichii]SCC97990.1 Hypothetical protein PFR_JS12-1_2022 [Propionibacterium freudenreichii]